jgi:hypothetical protein
MDTSLVFIVVRNIQTPQFNLFWQECVKSIRRFYSHPIYIVDTGSNSSLVSTNISLENCTTVESKYPGTYFFSGYLFLLDILDKFDRAVVIHDGIIFQQQMEFNAVKNIKFFWHFETHQWDNCQLEEAYLQTLPYSDELLSLYRAKWAWFGCFGLITVIEKSFLQHLHTVYNLPEIGMKFKSKDDAMAMERVFAVLCYREYPELRNDVSFQGDFRNLRFGYDWNCYINKVDSDKPVIKLFGQRS